MLAHGVWHGVKARLGDAGRACVARGAPPGWFGYRWVRHETVQAYFARHDGASSAGCYATVHSEAVASNPLPCNIASRDQLDSERGWWGFSFRDVPARMGGETFIATIPDCRVAWYRDPGRGGNFHPAVLSGDGTALDLRELRFRPPHAEVLRRSGRSPRLERAVWIIERVYDNYSHWVTAHLPKVALLREQGLEGGVLLPAHRTAAMDASLRLLRVLPESLRTFDGPEPLAVGALTLIGTDRLRPELLRLVPAALSLSDAPAPHRRLFISRAKAGRRRLINENDLWPLLAAAGFERVHLEDLTFDQQVASMRETAVLCGLHGAGLANMLFCPPGTHVIEIADPDFPNPNFYALAAALRHPYWLLHGEAVDGAPRGTRSHGVTGTPRWLEGPESCRPGWRDLRVDLQIVRHILPSLAGEPCRPHPGRVSG